MSEYTVPEGEVWRFQPPDQCPHCPEGVTIRRSLLDDHIAEAHADLPPCTARISNAGTGDQAVRCRFRVGHRDDSGDYHAGPYGERMGRLRWGDHAMGAVPHHPLTSPAWRPGDGHERCPERHGYGPDILQCVFRAGHPPHGHTFEFSNPGANADGGAEEPVDDRLRQAEIRAAVAEHEAEAYRNQVHALVRELLRARDLPEEDLPQKVRVIIFHEEAP